MALRCWGSRAAVGLGFALVAGRVFAQDTVTAEALFAKGVAQMDGGQ
jgi:hypothetical protein